MLVSATSTGLLGCAEVALPTATPSIAPVLSGTVYERTGTADDKRPLADVTVRAEHWDSSKFIFGAETTTDQQGRYRFTDLPTGMEISVTASKTGFTKRYRHVTLQPATPMTLHFGQSREFFDYDFPMDDRPEIGTFPYAITGTYMLLSLFEPEGGFHLNFSEAMDTASVEDQIQVIMASDAALPSGIVLAKGDRLFAKSDFRFHWLGENSAVEVRLLPGRGPAPRPLSEAALFNLKITFTGPVQDATGVKSSENLFSMGGWGYFDHMDYKRSMEWYKPFEFDTKPPSLEGLTLTPGSEGSSDNLKMTFSETMQVILSATGPIPSSSMDTSAINPANVIITEGTFEIPVDCGSLAVNGNQADASRVRLTADPAQNFFQAGDTLHFDTSGQSAVILSVTDEMVELDRPVTVSDNESVSLAKIGSSRTLDSPLFQNLAGTIEVGFDLSRSQVIVDFGNDHILQSGSTWRVHLRERITDPAGNLLAANEASAAVP